MAELNHRIKNMLTVVIGLARQTLARTAGPAAFVEAFQGRLHALARTAELLSQERWGEIGLRELLMRGLRPFALAGEASRVMADGPPISLRPKAATALGMVVHELATNAMKHGALSVSEGRVDLRWSLGSEPGERHLVLFWEEHGGPPPALPAPEGLGLTLIRRELSYALGGEARIDFAEEGLRARLVIPVDPTFVRVGRLERR